MDEMVSMRERRTALASARAALTGIGSVLWQESGVQLGPVLREIDDLGRLVEAARVAVVEEAMTRGEMRSHTGPHSESEGSLDEVAAGLVGVAWAREWAPTLKAGGAAAMVRLTERLRSHERSQLREAVLTGRVGVRNAAVCVREMDRMTPRLFADAVPTVWDALIQLGSQFGPREIRAVRPRLVAEYGADGELQDEQDGAARNAALSQPHDAGDGTFEYRLRLDAEGKTVLEAALGPLAAPRPADGVPDARGSDRRRSDALIEIVRRAVACPEGVPTTAKAQVFLSVDIDDLIRRTRCATTIGSADAGALMAPETLRRMACDAGVLPVVMGGPSHLLDLGRASRLFSPAQVRALWLRDGSCTIPGCGAPAQWADAHHIRHWADGGPSDLGNATLLCGHHHRWVHDHRLAATINREGRVVWDLAPGSYDQTRRDRH
jgi:hypothetical protein